MAINDIKIKSHDIYLERNGDKGGNLNIGASTTTNSLTVNTTTNNKGGLIVGTSDSPSYLDVYGVINNNGNLTVSGTITGNTLAVGSGGLTVSASTTTNSLTVNTNTINKGNLTVGTSTTQGNIDVYGNILLSGNSGGSIASYNGLTISAPYITFTTSPNYITFNTPTMVMNTTNTNNNGNLTVGTSSAQGDIKVYGNILLYGNTERTISCKDRLNLDTPYINFSGSTNSTIINSPMINIKTENINIENCYYKKVCNLSDVCDPEEIDFNYKMIPYTGPFTGITEVKCYELTISSSLSDSEIEDFNKYRSIGYLKLIVEFESETREIILSDNGFTLDGRTLKLEASGNPDTRDHPNLTYNNYRKLNEATRAGEDIYGVTFMVLSSQKDIALSINQKTSVNINQETTVNINQEATVNINKHKHVLLNCASTGTTNISYFPNTVYNTKYQKLVVVTANSVSLRPGDFIEFYPTVTGPCYLFCDALGLDTNHIMPLNTTAGCIYYEPTGTKAYIYCYGQDGITERSLISAVGSTLLIKFHNGDDPHFGKGREVIIKR